MKKFVEMQLDPPLIGRQITPGEHVHQYPPSVENSGEIQIRDPAL